MVNFSLRALVAFLIFLSVSSVYAQTKVVVIPLGGDDIDQCEAITACNGGQITLSCPSGNEHISCSSPKLVFLTSSTHTGDLGGLEGADEICQDLANDAGRFGEFKAWLSENGSSPSDRMTQDTSHYFSTDGKYIAPGVMEPGDPLFSSDFRDENGILVNPSIWTGWFHDFPNVSADCASWTIGDIGATADFTEIRAEGLASSGFGRATCGVMFRLMCLEQIDTGN